MIPPSLNVSADAPLVGVDGNSIVLIYPTHESYAARMASDMASLAVVDGRPLETSELSAAGQTLRLVLRYGKPAPVMAPAPVSAKKK